MCQLTHLNTRSHDMWHNSDCKSGNSAALPHGAALSFNEPKGQSFHPCKSPFSNERRWIFCHFHHPLLQPSVAPQLPIMLRCSLPICLRIPDKHCHLRLTAHSRWCGKPVCARVCEKAVYLPCASVCMCTSRGEGARVPASALATIN